MMAHDYDLNAAFKISIYDRVWENLQRDVDADSSRFITASGGHNCAWSAMPSVKLRDAALLRHPSRTMG